MSCCKSRDLSFMRISEPSRIYIYIIKQADSSHWRRKDRMNGGLCERARSGLQKQFDAFIVEDAVASDSASVSLSSSDSGSSRAHRLHSESVLSSAKLPPVVYKLSW